MAAAVGEAIHYFTLSFLFYFSGMWGVGCELWGADCGVWIGGDLDKRMRN